MGIIIREMTKNDIEGKAYVHYKSCHETYSGLISDIYMKNITLEKCIDTVNKYPENTIVAIADSKVAGFACYGQSRDEDMSDTGELIALYLLEKYKGRGIGKLLADACFEKMSDYTRVSLWVLSQNKNAIGFYENYGFRADGVKKTIRLGEPIEKMRMIKYH